MFAARLKNKKQEKGQVLIFALVILIVLVIATLLLFDLHSIVRSKMKLETAEQAAALTAGRWQVRSLNLIGEINLVKAVGSLIDDIPTEGETDEEKIASASRTLTEMQTRISFCGPLIGFGAAQQAAKNNGIDIYAPEGSSGYKSVHDDFKNYLRKLDSNSPNYAYNGLEVVNNYYWQDSYVSMLEAILEQGLAARPNGRFPGLESIDPPWLDDNSLYSAILNKMWCNPTLNSVVKYSDSYWNGKWYNVDFDHTSFPDESEIYTLGIRFTGTSDIDKEDLERALDEAIDSSRLEKLEPIQWCAYDSKWPRYNTDGTTQNLNYSGPNNDGLNYWSRGMFLHDNLQKGMFYGGPVAYAECYQKIRLLNKYKSRMSTPPSNDSVSAGAGQNAVAREALRNGVIRKTEAQTLKVGNDSATDNDSGGAVAKPLGSLPDGNPPTDAVIVLPIFTTSALIPSTMQGCRPLRLSFSSLEIFLMWLSEVEDIHNPATAPPKGTEHYLTALQKLDDPTFRKSGWNNNYVRKDSSLSVYFGDSYKYNPNTNPNGAGWLQQIWVGTDMTKDEDAPTELHEEEAGWNTRIYSGRRYLLKSRNGVLQTNEKMICRWAPAGPNGHLPGTKIGPPRL